MLVKGDRSERTRQTTQSSANCPVLTKLYKKHKCRMLWKQRYLELVEYQSEHKHCLVPTKYALNKKLGLWVMTQRRQYSLLEQGKPSTLSAEKVGMLDRIGFVWKIRAKKNSPWAFRLEQLKQFKTQYGNCMVPQRFKPNLALGAWVNTQRRHYRLLKQGEKSIMTISRIEALNALGFEWDARKQPSSLNAKSNGIPSHDETTDDSFQFGFDSPVMEKHDKDFVLKSKKQSFDFDEKITQYDDDVQCSLADFAKWGNHRLHEGGQSDGIQLLW